MLDLETKSTLSAAAVGALPAAAVFARDASANSAPTSASVAHALAAIGTVATLFNSYLEADRTQLTPLMSSPMASFGDHLLLYTGVTTFARLYTGATTFPGFELPIDKIIAMASGLVAKASREDVLQKIDNFAHASDWAGPRTLLPSDSTQLVARTFIEGLPLSIPTPHVSVGADGAIGFEWETRQDYVAVEIQADASVVWMHRRQGKMVGGEEVVWHGRIPGQLSERLNQTFA
jgi:hypothetical protein